MEFATQHARLKDRIRRLLKQGKTTQEQLSAYTGIPQSTISRWLSDESVVLSMPRLDDMVSAWRRYK
jgi:transcriptional regulator with XRE-family HTH domain